MHLYAWLHILLAYTCRHFTCNVMVIECVCVCVLLSCVCVLIEFCVCVCPLVFLLLYDLCNHAFLYSHVSYMYIKCYVCICILNAMCVYACTVTCTCIRVCISTVYLTSFVYFVSFVALNVNIPWIQLLLYTLTHHHPQCMCMYSIHYL